MSADIFQASLGMTTRTRYYCHGLVLPEADYHRYRSNLISSDRAELVAKHPLLLRFRVLIGRANCPARAHQVRADATRTEVEGVCAPSSSVDMTINLFFERKPEDHPAVGHLARLPNAMRIESLGGFSK